MCWKKNDCYSKHLYHSWHALQCTYRLSLLMLKGQSLAHWAVLRKVEHLNDQKSTCMMSGQVNANKIIVMWGWVSHNMQLYYIRIVFSCMSLLVCLPQLLLCKNWLGYFQWYMSYESSGIFCSTIYMSVGSLQILQLQIMQEAQCCYNLCADTACFSLVHRSLLPWDKAMLV